MTKWLLLIFLFPAIAAAACVPPPSGNGTWNVTAADNCYLQNVDWTINGSLYVYGGVLLLTGSTLRMNCNAADDQWADTILNYPCNISIAAGSRFEMGNGSKINTTNPNFETGFLVNNTAEFQVNNSDFSEIGYVGGVSFQVETERMNITHSNFTDVNGLTFLGTNFSNFSHNNVTFDITNFLAGRAAVAFRLPTNNVTIAYNNISRYWSEGGIGVRNGAGDFNITNNRIFNARSAGFNINTTSYMRIENNEIINISASAFFLNNTRHSTFQSNYVNNTTFGISLMASTNAGNDYLNFSYNSVSTYHDFCFHASESATSAPGVLSPLGNYTRFYGNRFENCSVGMNLSGIGLNQSYFENNTIWNVTYALELNNTAWVFATNSSFNGSNSTTSNFSFIDATSYVNVSWVLYAGVVDANNGNSISTATMSATDVNSVQQWTANTNSSGNITHIVQQYDENSAGKTYYNAYTLYTGAPSFYGLSASVSFPSSVFYQASLSPVTPGGPQPPGEPGEEGTRCGNEICEPEIGENYTNCPIDCHCGDGLCNWNETGETCPEDCRCGDSVCSLDENSTSCPEDCYCGDGVCRENEMHATCPEDCYCGDGVCGYDENWLICPQDCAEGMDCRIFGCPEGFECIYYAGGYLCAWPCENECPAPFVLDPLTCECICLEVCPSGRALNPDTCQCVCDVACGPGQALNETTCECYAAAGFDPVVAVAAAIVVAAGAILYMKYFRPPPKPPKPVLKYPTRYEELGLKE